MKLVFVFSDCVRRYYSTADSMTGIAETMPENVELCCRKKCDSRMCASDCREIRT